MFDIPKIINIQLTPDNELLSYFETGIIKKIDLKDFTDDKKDNSAANINFTPDGLVLNGKTISNCDLWSSAKFCDWSNSHVHK